MAGAGGAGSGRLVCLGRIAGAWGVKGGVRIRSYTAEPLDIAAYGPLTDETGAGSYRVRAERVAKGMVLAWIDGVADREAAEALKGVRLYVPRERLPETAPDEFYHEDLIGLEARLADGAPLGRVISVQEYGAGDMLEVKLGTGATVLVPFTRAMVPEIDLAAGRVVVDPPPGLLDGPGAPEAGEGS